MLTEYETGFTILETSELTGVALLTDVADRLESLLADSRSEASPVSTEREISASSGYAIIGADRLHRLDPEHTLRIQARLCAERQAVTAQIRSRFISADDNDPADLTAGPPHILQEIVESYNCEIGTYQFRNKVFPVEDNGIANRVLGFIKNANRKIPVLVLTELNGRTAIDPQNVLDYLLGLALVVRFRGDTSRRIGEATGRACFDGSMRFYWPGDSVGKYYSPNDVTRNSLTRFQKDCIENAELHDLNGDFEQIFSAARMRVIREQKDELLTLPSRDAAYPENQVSLLQHELSSVREEHSETEALLIQARERIGELERQAEETEANHSQTVDELLEQLNSARTNSISDSEKDKEIRKLNTAVSQWKRRLRQSDESNKQLKETNRELGESLERAEAGAVATKIPVIAEGAQGLSLTGNARIDNITILNHAINIYRNPARQYIIKALRKRYNNNLIEICEAIERTMNSDDDRRRLREAKSNSRPQDGIDVGNFEYIVMNNTACFGGKRRLSTKMSEVRQVRNAAAHPEYNGIDDLKAKDGLNKVAGALKEMGNNDYGKLVEQLLPFVR